MQIRNIYLIPFILLILSFCSKELLIVSGMICSYKTILLIAHDSIILQILTISSYWACFFCFTVDTRLSRPSFSGSLLLPLAKCVLAPIYSKIISLYHTVDTTVTEVSLFELIKYIKHAEKPLLKSNIVGNVPHLSNFNDN